MMSKCTKHLLRSLFIVCIICIMIIPLNAIDFDNEWHEVEQVGLQFSNIGSNNFITALGGSSGATIGAVNVPYIREVGEGLNQISPFDGFYITIPLRGDFWQVDASKGFEVRFVVSTQNTYYQECYGMRGYYDALPVDNGSYFPLGIGDWSISSTRFRGVTNTELVKQAYINGSYVDTVLANRDIDAFVETQPLFDDVGCIYNFYINPNIIPNWVRSVTFFIGTNSGAAMRRFCINSVGVRNYNITDELSVQKSILANVQELASRQGMTSDDISSAIVQAYEQLKNEDKTAADDSISELENSVNDILGDLKIEGIQSSLEELAGLFDFSSDSITPFIIDIPETVINLSGRQITVFPNISYNLTANINNILTRTYRRYPEFLVLTNVIGIVLTICIGIACVKIVISLIQSAFSSDTSSTGGNDNV